MSDPDATTWPDLYGRDPEEDMLDVNSDGNWQVASELAYRRGCFPDNDCWSECRECAAESLRDHLTASPPVPALPGERADEEGQ